VDEMLRLPRFWWIVLVISCVVLPYLLGTPPRRRRDWILLTVTIAFLTWLLAGFGSVRSR
jgi:hypothetical protein